jgi:hypothetical protein
MLQKYVIMFDKEKGVKTMSQQEIGLALSNERRNTSNAQHNLLYDGEG